jgi:cell division protein FtsI (penicillin-binding protein 3)
MQVPKADAKSVARNRLFLAGALAASCFILIGGQVISVSTDVKTRVFYGTDDKNMVERGRIYDRNGRILATSLPAFMLYADPTEIMDPYEAAAKLETILPHLEEEEIFNRLISEGRFTELSWRVSPATYAKTLEQGVVGVYGRKRMTRFYPQGEEAAHVIGLVNKDSQGLIGVEAGTDDILARGEDVHLAVDIAVQAILREELQEQIEKFEALGGAGVVIDVKTGEIISLVSLPQYDPNHYANTTKDQQFNRATKGIYEMGSTFKIISTAIALESGQFSVNDMIDVVSPLQIGRFTISDFHPEKKPLNVAEVMVVSSNIGSARIAQELGAKIQKKFLKQLGLIDSLDLEIPEVSKPLTPETWHPSSVMTISYGHGISISPAHLATAVATTLGDGNLVIPSLIKGGIDSDFEEQIFSPETVETMRAIIRNVVTHERGTGKNANARGYVVGGKTGTSEKNSVDGYDEDLNIASFVAGFPAHDPRYVIVVMVDEPKGQEFSYGYSTGGWVAAPAVGRFINRAAVLLNVPPVNEKSPEIRRLLSVDLPQLDAEVRNASY